jgi:hypothetical protein
VQYQEAELKKYMPMKLVLDAEEKIRVLKHAEVWESTVPQETPAMVMQSMVDFSTNLKTSLPTTLLWKSNVRYKSLERWQESLSISTSRLGVYSSYHPY